MGVKKGDIVTIYLPQIPEQVFAMLACAKIGAAHSVVYGGFSHDALADRINDAASRVVVTADGGFRRGKSSNLKEIVNQALEMTPTVEVCITIKRTGVDVYMENDRDYWFHDLKGLPIAGPKCDTEVMDAEDMLFIYTLPDLPENRKDWYIHMAVTAFILVRPTKWFSILSPKTAGGALPIRVGLQAIPT